MYKVTFYIGLAETDAEEGVVLQWTLAIARKNLASNLAYRIRARASKATKPADLMPAENAAAEHRKSAVAAAQAAAGFRAKHSGK